MENYYTIRRLLMILDLSASPHDYSLYLSYQFFHLKLYHLSYGTLECHVETGHLGHDWLNSIWKGECCYGYMDVDVINELYRWGRMDAFFIISLRANDSLDEDGVILMIKMP